MDQWNLHLLWMSNNMFGAPPMLQGFLEAMTLSTFAPLMSWTVMFFEIALFACILATSRRIKESFLFFGIVFHFMILISFGLISFYFSMFGALVLYLDDENTIAKTMIKYLKSPVRWRLRNKNSLETNWARE